MSEDWRATAVCKPPRIGPPIPTRIFYPEKGESSAPAKAICAVCPSRDGCLQDSLLTFDRHGIRGGKSEKQRRKLRQQKRCRQCGDRFVAPRPQSVYCSDPCREEAHSAQKRAAKARSNTKHGTRSCYVMGCSRPECRQADADYQAARWRARQEAS